MAKGAGKGPGRQVGGRRAGCMCGAVRGCEM